MKAAAVYDSGVLVAADKNSARVWDMHRDWLRGDMPPVVPAPVVSQAWRDGTRQTQLARMLKSCIVTPYDHSLARRVGELLGVSGTLDAVDAVVALVAADCRATIYTSDPDDINRLLAYLGDPGRRASIYPV